MSRAFVRSAGACHRYSLALCFALGGLIAVTAVVILLIQHSWKPVEQRLSDGTILRVEAMTLGSTHLFSKDPVMDKIREWLPNSMKPLLGKGNAMVTMQTDSNSLVVWCSRFGSLTPAGPGVSTERYYITDSHGCRFPSYSWHRVPVAGNQLTGLAFEAFPRGEEDINLVIRSSSSDEIVGQIKFPNRFRVDSNRLAAKWAPEQLPILKTNDNLVVCLQRLWRWDLAGPRFSPDLWILQPDDPALWQKGSVYVCDRWGNRSSQPRCTNESVCKVEASFFRKASAQFRTEELWTITNVAIPKAGKTLSLQRTNTVQGRSITVETLTGPAEGGTPRIPAEGVILKTRSIRQGKDEDKIIVRAYDNLRRNLVVEVPDPRLFGGYFMSPRERVEEFYIQPLPDSTSLDIEVVVQKPIVFEFFVELAKKNRVPSFDK